MLGSNQKVVCAAFISSGSVTIGSGVSVFCFICSQT